MRYLPWGSEHLVSEDEGGRLHYELKYFLPMATPSTNESYYEPALIINYHDTETDRDSGDPNTDCWQYYPTLSPFRCWPNCVTPQVLPRNPLLGADEYLASVTVRIPPDRSPAIPGDFGRTGDLIGPVNLAVLDEWHGVAIREAGGRPQLSSDTTTINLSSGPKAIAIEVEARDLGVLAESPLPNQTEPGQVVAASGAFAGELVITPSDPSRPPNVEETNDATARRFMPFSHRFFSRQNRARDETHFRWNIVLPVSHPNGEWDVYIRGLADVLGNVESPAPPPKYVETIRVSGGLGQGREFAPHATYGSKDNRFPPLVDGAPLAAMLPAPIGGRSSVFGVLAHFEMNGYAPIFRKKEKLNIDSFSISSTTVDVRNGPKIVPFSLELARPTLPLPDARIRVGLTDPGDVDDIGITLVECPFSRRHEPENVLRFDPSIPAGWYTVRVEIEENPGQPRSESAVYGSTGKALVISPLPEPYIIRVIND